MLDVDQPLSHVGAEMMMLDSNVLGARPQLGASSKLDGTHIVLEHLTSNGRNTHGDVDTEGDEFGQQLHDVDDIA